MLADPSLPSNLSSVLLMVYWPCSSTTTANPGAVELIAYAHLTSIEVWSEDTSQPCIL